VEKSLKKIELVENSIHIVWFYTWQIMAFLKIYIKNEINWWKIMLYKHRILFYELQKIVSHKLPQSEIKKVGFKEGIAMNSFDFY